MKPTTEPAKPRPVLFLKLHPDSSVSAYGGADYAASVRVAHWPKVYLSRPKRGQKEVRFNCIMHEVVWLEDGPA